MEDLAYFAANAPDRTLRRTARLNAAAIILLFVALPLGWSALQLSRDLFDLTYRAIFYSEEWLMLLFTSGAALYFVISAVGLLMRRRWSRPLVLIAATTWLTFGAIGMLILLIMEVRSPYRDGFDYYYPSEAFIEVASTALIGIVVPWLIYFLVRPADVRRSLEYFDSTPRPSDTWSIRRGSTVLTLLVTGVIGATFFATIRHNYWWPTDLKPWFSIGSTVGLFFFAAIALAFGANNGRRIAIACLLMAIVMLMYVGLNGGNRRPFRYNDSSVLFGFGITIAAVCVLRIRRIGKMPERETIADDEFTANTQ